MERDRQHILGGRREIRVYTATNISSRQTAFRNENCGAYFAADSTNGWRSTNHRYENIKGLRWGSRSVNGHGHRQHPLRQRERGI